MPDLIKHFSWDAGNTIWNMVVHATDMLIILEVRDEQAFQTTLAAVHARTGEVRWSGVQLSEPWWISLLEARNGVVLVQEYLTRGNPDHKALVALDTTNHRIRWRVNEFSFHHWQEGTILGYATEQDPVQAVIHVATGECVIQAWEHTISHPPSVIHKPVLYAQGIPYFTTVSRFLRQALTVTAVGAIEYMERAHSVCISYYVEQAHGLANYLLVTDREGRVMLHDVLGTGLKGLGTDTFFNLSDCLIFVKNKKELVSYRL